MAQKYTLAASATAFMRMTGEPIQLSDGTLVFIYHSASDYSAPVLAYSTDRVTVVPIATLGTAAGQFSKAFPYYTLTRDAADNIYVIGTYDTTTYLLLCQAFVKGPGYTWTPQNRLPVSSNSNSANLYSKTALWCNTGGGTNGAGHIVVLVNEVTTSGMAWVLDAGVMLAGGGSIQTYVNGITGADGSDPFGFAADGFGATSGIFAGAMSNGFKVNSWSVSSAGLLTVTALAAPNALGTFSGARMRVVRYAPNAFAVFQPTSSSSPNYAVSRYSKTAQLTAATAAPAPTGWPNNSANLTWDVFLDVDTPNRCWVVTFDTSTGVVKRLSVDLSSGVSWAAAVKTDDTLSPFFGPNSAFYGSNPSNSRLFAVNQPVISTVDWLAYIETASTPTYALVGNYTRLNVAPNAPTLTGPADGSTIDRTILQRFSWTFSDPDAGDVQSAFDLRYSSDGGVTWTTISGTTANQFVDVAANTFAAGNYRWQVRTYDSLGVVGTWSTQAFFTAATPPAAVTITAPISGGTIASGSYDLAWSAPAQDAYQVRIVADDGTGNPNTATVYSDTGQVTDSVARMRTMPFPTNNIYVHPQVRIKLNNLWSSWADIRALVSYTPPAIPTVAVAVLTDPDLGNVGLAVTTSQPTPSGGQPTVTSVDIYRRKVGEVSQGSRRAKDLSPSSTWPDYRVNNGVPYEYLARAHGNNGTSTDSEWTA